MNIHKELQILMKRVSRKQLLLLVLFFSLALFGMAILQITTNNKWLKEEYKIQEEFITQKENFEKLGFFIKTAEAAKRGYVLTGNESFIEGFAANIDSIKVTARPLQSLVELQIKPQDKVQLLKLDTLIRNKIVFMQQVLTLAEVNRPGAANLIATGEGERLADAITATSKTLIDSYKMQLQNSKARFWRVKSVTSQIAWFCIAFSILLTLLVFWLLFCEIRRTQKTSEELQLQKEHYRTTINCIGEGLITTGKNGEIYYMNPAAERMTGWQNQEAKSRPLEEVYDVVNEASGKSSKNIVSRILEHGKYYAMENNTILRTKFSDERVISNSGSPLFDLNGDISGTVLVFNDITEKKIKENKIKESEEKYRLLIEQAADGIFIVDLQGNFLETNSMGCKMLGYSKKELLQLNLTDITPAEFAGKMPVNLTRLLSGDTILVERKFKCKDNTEFYCEFNAKLATGGHIQAIVRDITERKIAEHKFNTTSNELALVVADLNKTLDSSLDVICTINTTGEFVNVSASSQQVWGYEAAELIGSKFLDLVHHEDVDRSSKAAANIAKDIQIPIFENRYIHKSGRIVYMLWSVNWDEKLQLMYCIAKDVTEKKILEKAVENERDQFFEIFSKAPSAIGMLKGADHVFEMANPLYLQLTGKKDIIGKTVAEVLPEVIEQGFIDMLDNVYRTGESYIGKETFVQVVKEGNGEKADFYMNFIYQAYRNAEGKIEGVFFFINDITEQILSRKKIEKSEKFFKGVIENSAEMITLTDAAGNAIYASPAVTKNFGYTYEECLEINIVDIIHPDDALVMQEFFEEIKMHPGVTMECPLIRDRKKDGSYAWVEGTVTNFLETEGINAIIANFRDVTERKKADEENRFKANLLNRIGQAAIATDIDGIINYWNRAAEDIYGWTREEALGKNIIDLTPSEASNEQAIQIMEELKKGHTWSGEFKVRKKDGTNFPALVTNSPIYDEQNELSGIIGISTDITEKKELEELLEKSNKMARIGSWEIDVVNSTVFWSDITKEIREVAPDFIPRFCEGISNFKEGRDKEIITQRVRDCIEKGLAWDDELEIVTHKGNNKWVRTIGEGEFADGKCVKVYGSSQDITSRKKAEIELQESELFNKSILTSISSHIAVVNEEGEIISVNKAWNDFALNNGESSLIRTGQGSNYLEVCRQAALAGDKTAAEALAGMEKVLNKDIAFFEMEYPCHSSSEQRWFLLRITSFMGDFPKIVTVHTNITARKLAEIKGLIAIERYETLAKATSDTIWDEDMVSNKILYNEGMTKMMGYQKGEVEGVTEWRKQKIHPDDLGFVLCSLNKVLKNREQTFQLEYRFRCADGSYKNIFDRAFVNYDEQGNPIRMIGAMQDITHKKEEEIRIAKAIVEAQEGERNQLGMELHDNVNQLLTASLLYIGLAKKHQHKEDFYQMLDTCKLHITDAIKETRKLSHQLAPASHDYLSLKNIFELLISSMNLNNSFAVDLHFNDFKEDTIAKGIQIALYRVLQEQMNNIVKYAEASIVEVSVTIAAGNVKLSITDNGKGFNMHAVKTGIGLQNIKRRAEMYAGKFTCTSAPGKGCEVIVVIPLVSSN